MFRFIYTLLVRVSVRIHPIINAKKVFSKSTKNSINPRHFLLLVDKEKMPQIDKQSKVKIKERREAPWKPSKVYFYNGRIEQWK